MHTKNKAIVVIAMLILFLIPVVNAAPPFQSSVATANGLVFEYHDYPYMKWNTTQQFHFHVFNQSNGYPITNTSVRCYFHLYNSSGNHIFIKNPPMKFDDDWDWEVTVDAGNFTQLGHYSNIFQCNGTAATGGGFVSQVFEITKTGEAPPADVFKIFFILAAIAAIVASIYFFVELMQKFPLLSITALDFAKNLIVFICLIFLYGMNQNYFGDALIENIFKVMMIFGALGNVAASAFVTVISYVRKLFQMRKWGQL